MRIRRIDRKIEKDILIGMITDKEYLSRVRPVANLSFFKNSYCRTIASWIFTYYDKYSEPPFSDIQKIYDYNERRGQIEEDDIDPIKNILQQAADQYAECPNLNYQFLLEKTEEYFNRVNLEKLFSQSQELMEQGKVEEAQSLVLGVKTIKIGEHSGTDGLTDEAELQAAFEDSGKPLFKLPGDLGRMVNSELARDHFLVLQAPEKTGKTWWLMMLALRALRSRLKVVMIEMEMTKNQVNKRMSITISGRSDQKKYCDGVHIPKKFVPADTGFQGVLPGGMGIHYEDIGEQEPLVWQSALKENQAFYDRFRLKKDQHWRLITVPARSMNIRQIDAELDRLEKEEDFVADVVLIDYMDILAPENKGEQDRERINSNWVAAKAMCNKRHIFLASVTQANAMAYGQELQTRSNFSEDHRKYAHTNGTLGLTQTPKDKAFGVAKINWLVLRDGDYNELNACYILQCLKRGRFCVDSATRAGFEKRNDIQLKEVQCEERPAVKEQKKIQRLREDRARRSTRRDNR